MNEGNRGLDRERFESPCVLITSREVITGVNEQDTAWLFTFSTLDPMEESLSSGEDNDEVHGIMGSSSPPFEVDHAVNRNGICSPSPD